MFWMGRIVPQVGEGGWAVYWDFSWSVEWYLAVLRFNRLVNLGDEVGYGVNLGY